MIPLKTAVNMKIYIYRGCLKMGYPFSPYNDLFGAKQGHLILRHRSQISSFIRERNKEDIYMYIYICIYVTF
jgi:hypothetical protein